MKFIVTKELGRLSRWLRILGFDTLYFTSASSATLTLEALRENRTIITRKKTANTLLKKQTLLVTSEELEEQLKEVMEKLDLKINKDKMFTRCTICNQLLQEIEKEKIKEQLPEYVAKTQNFFMHCPECKRNYWQGSHWGNVNKVIAKTLMNANIKDANLCE